MKEKSITMNLADFMSIFEKNIRAVDADEKEVLRYMIKMHNMLVKNGMVEKI